jgi:diaminohydroxyphosphoribosylaminopyrimidine deaminase / 5-amino-6-(5-phosphoribosylamino)uracil reductase
VTSTADIRWMNAALALSERSRAVSAPNPNVGCIITRDGHVVGRGWTQSRGRPHAEAVALAAAGKAASGATVYVSLEPCAHDSARGPACADSLIAAGVARVVIALTDPDPRTQGQGIGRLKTADIVVDTNVAPTGARRAMAGWLMQQAKGRPFVTLKLAVSLDGCIALADGESRWITGAAARAHGHLERARSSMILVGRGTFDADVPALDVRLPGLENRSPRRAILSHRSAPNGWTALPGPAAVFSLDDQYLLIEGGAQTAASFLKAGLVDRLLLYRAPILIGRGKASLGDIGLDRLADAQDQWHLVDARMLGKDRIETYEAQQCLQA